MNQAILDDIRTEFFKLVETNRNGYHISLIKAYEWLELEYNDKIRNHLTARTLKSEEYAFIESKSEEDLKAHYIIRKDGKKHIPWFSDDGFKMLCMISKSSKSKYVITHFIQCEKDYLRALKQSKEENEKELKELREKVNNFESRLLKIADERDSLLVKTHFYREDNTRLRKLEDQVATKEDFALEGTPEHKLVLLIKEKFFQKTPIYIVNPDYVNAKYVAKRKQRKRASDKKENEEEDLLNSDDEDVQTKEQCDLSLEDAIFNYGLLEYEVPYNEVFPGDLAMYSDMDFYYYIPGFKSKAERKPEIYQYVGEIEVLDRNHLTAIRNYYETRKSCITKVKSTYKTNYDNLTSVIYDKISADLFNAAHQK